MEVLLDSNFIISCVKRKIDFIDELKNLGFRVVVPRGVLQELKDLRLKVKHDERVAIDVGLEMIEKRKVEKGRVGGKTVDEGLIDKGRQGVHIATLDAVIKRNVPNRVIISDSGNSLKIERG